MSNSKGRRTKAVRAAMDPQRLASDFLNKHGQDSQRRRTLRYWRGEFWRYECGRYRPVSSTEFTAVLFRTLTEHIAAVPLKNSDGQLLQLRTGVVNNVRAALAGEVYVPDVVEQPAWLNGTSEHTNRVAMNNGILDLDAASAKRSYALRQLTPEWFSGVVIPYDYDPSADCPRWKKFVNEIYEGDEDRVALLQEWCGYLLAPDTSLHKFMVLEGEGANGKSVVLELIEGVVGSANTSHVPVEVFGDRFQMVPTINKLVNLAPEVNENAKLNEGVLKQFTAGDPIYIDRKGIPGIDVKPTARLMVATNHRPPISDRSSGVWRRMLYLPHRVTIGPEKQNPHLAAELKEELPGILNWALEGRKRLKAKGRFTEPALSREALAEYRSESNPARTFLTDQCVVDANARVSVEALYEAYKMWTTRNGCAALGGASFGKEVRKVFPTMSRVRGSDGLSRPWFYAGIAMMPAEEVVELPIAA